MTESKDKRVGWLAELEPGDQLHYEGMNFGTTPAKFIPVTVDHISPTGQITVRTKSGLKKRFSNRGYLIGGIEFHPQSLLKLSPEELKKNFLQWQHIKQVSKIENTNFRLLSMETIQKISLLIDEDERN